MDRGSPKSENTVLRWINRGDGLGEGKDFKPFFTIRAPTIGMATAFLGVITGRVHVCLSLLEYMYLVLFEFEMGTVDIREQFALLPRGETWEIARKLGIRHPVYRGTKIPIVMTSDLVITRATQDGPTRLAVAIKYSLDVNLKTDDEKKLKRVLRVLDLLRIERTYWRARNVPWKLFTESTLPVARFRNLDMFRSTMLRRESDHLNVLIPDFVNVTRAAWSKQPWIRLLDLLEYGSKRLTVSVDDAYVLFGRAVWTRQLAIDLDTDLMHHVRPLRLLPAVA